MLNGIYSLTDLEDIWKQAGGNPAQAKMAAAIALAESNGQPNATNTNTNGTIDRGLWQVNSVHGAQSTLDPLANAKSAVAISNNGTDWSPWTTYKTGAYKTFLGFSQFQPLPKGTTPTTPFSKIDPNADAGGAGGGVGGLTGVGGVGDVASTISGAIGGTISGAFNQAVNDLKYGVVLIAALVVAVMLFTHGLRGSGDGNPKAVPVPL